jgi:hypothetical protein
MQEPHDPPKGKGRMETPNQHLRALLLELAEKHNLSDSAIARAHNRAHTDSMCAPSSVQRFRHGPADAPPTALMEEAYAAATGTTRKANWNEAIRRWRAAEKG